MEKHRAIQRQGSVSAQLGKLELHVSKVCLMVDKGNDCLALTERQEVQLFCFPAKLLQCNRFNLQDG